MTASYRRRRDLPVVLGFLSALTLIAAIGAQNAFVLRQGIRGEHVAAVVALCTVSDVLLIGAGIAGFGALVTAHPQRWTSHGSVAPRS